MRFITAVYRFLTEIIIVVRAAVELRGFNNVAEPEPQGSASFWGSRSLKAMQHRLKIAPALT
jgi:hypothetical protein